MCTRSHASVNLVLHVNGGEGEFWTGGAGTQNFSDSANWSTGLLPGVADFACAPAGSTIHIVSDRTLRGIEPSVSSLWNRARLYVQKRANLMNKPPRTPPISGPMTGIGA